MCRKMSRAAVSFANEWEGHQVHLSGAVVVLWYDEIFGSVEGRVAFGDFLGRLCNLEN